MTRARYLIKENIIFDHTLHFKTSSEIIIILCVVPIKYKVCGIGTLDNT